VRATREKTASIGLSDGLAARILEESPDAILVCDVEGVVRYWNQGAERVFGFPREDVLNRSLDIIIPERFRDRHWAAWKAAMSTGVTRYNDGELLGVPAVHQDGRQISIEFSIQLVNGASERPEWVVAFIRDVTERYIREKALRAALQTQYRSGGTNW
jgi:PAS domain S-box-containing protein